MKEKNLLFIFADQWRRTAVGFMNEEDVITPNIDKFSKESLVLTNAVSTSPLCSPSRASILTGTYPMTHGVYTNCKLGLNEVFLRENDITILDVLKENGYYLGYIGKWHLDNPEQNKEENPKSGAREWDAYTPKEKRHGVDYWYAYNAYDNHLKPHYWNDSDKMIEIDEWSVKHETDKALEFLKNNKEKKFSLFVSYNPPHTPLDLVPQKYVEMYKDKKLRRKDNLILNDVIDHTKTMDKALNFNDNEYTDIQKKYYAAITGIDENIGKIIEYLKENNLYDDTIIVITADHGEMLCSQGLWSKHVWYEESISVPFLIRVPELYEKGETNTVLSGVDIMPTILSILDLKIPKTVQGTDLKNELLNENSNNVAYITAYPGQIKAIDEFKKLNKSNLDFGWRGIKSKDETYVIFNGYYPNQPKEKWLYDNKNDKEQIKPLDVTNLETDKINEYNNMLRKYFERTKDKFEI